MTLSSITYPAQSNPTHALVMLHGWGANAQDLASLAPLLIQPNVTFLFPDAPYQHPLNPDGRMWYDLESGQYLEEVTLQLKNWILSLPDMTQVPLNKIVLGGFSQGGAMTLDLGYDLPLGGLISLSGYLHPNVVPNRTFQSKPILMIHGKQDPVVPLQAAQSACNQFEEEGLSVDYHELDMGHEVTPNVLEIMQSFLQQIIQ